MTEEAPGISARTFISGKGLTGKGGEPRQVNGDESCVRRAANIGCTTISTFAKSYGELHISFLDIPLSELEHDDTLGAWLPHGPLGIWLVNALRPRRIVELGTHDGFSYFSFCRAVEENRIAAACAAFVTCDEWAHDNKYTEYIYEKLKRKNTKFEKFSKIDYKITLEAIEYFEDHSIELLHINNVFFKTESYLKKIEKKLSDNAIILLSGTSVSKENSGSGDFWSDVSRARPSLNFARQDGLEVVFWGGAPNRTIASLMQLIQDPVGRSAALAFFELAGEANIRDKNHKNYIEENRKESFRLNKENERQFENLRYLQQLIVDARRKPLQQLKRKLAFKLLRSLSRASPPLSRRTAMRFARSAAKRDPDRDDLHIREEPGDYRTILGKWQEQRDGLDDRLERLVDRLRDGPLISVVVPVYDPDPGLLAETIESVMEQRYPNWELCLADDCSSDERVREVLRHYSARDKRIRVVFRQSNGHISAATNSAIEIARGQYIALLDHDDLLDRDALLLAAKVISDNPDIRIIYTDEDKISENGARYDPHFKPDWNRELLYGMNYVSHLGIYDTALVREAGRFRVGFEGAQDYDLLLRCVEKVEDNQIHHIPKVLYSWRATPGSAAASSDAKPYATEAGRKALAEHLKRETGDEIEVERGPYPFTYRAVWPIKGNPLVSIIIPTRDHLDFLKVAVSSILEKTDYENFEIIIVDNGSSERRTLEWLGAIEARDNRVRVRRDERPFNYSALNNAAVAASRGEFIALLNNDVEVMSPQWLTEMLSLAQRRNTGCVGAKLFYPDGRIQHGGVIIGLGGCAGHAHKLFPGEHDGYYRRLKLRQEFSAVTAACLLVRREIYDAVGGLNETDLTVAFNDVDFCLKVRAAGYRNVWTPHAELVHNESISRGFDDTPEKIRRSEKEVGYMISRWQINDFPDPAYNPNLTLDAEDFSFAHPQWEP